MNFMEFVNSITDEEYHEIMKDYEILRRDTVIGDCLLRRKAEEYEKLLNIPMSVVMTMEAIVHEGLHRFYQQSLKNNKPEYVYVVMEYDCNENDCGCISESIDSIFFDKVEAEERVQHRYNSYIEEYEIEEHGDPCGGCSGISCGTCTGE